jgi:hypothetical protein
MNNAQAIWLAAALVGVVAVAVLACAVIGRQSARPTPAVRAAWLVAATTSGTMLVLVGAKVGDLIPHATAIDVAALAVTGILTGAFLALGLKPSARNGLN